MTITLYFEQGTNPDIAQVQVQNKLQLATPLLPIEVQQQGLRVAKATRNFLLVIGFYSTDGRMNSEDIERLHRLHVQDPISRTPGVGDFQLFGTQYAMRIWLDPAKLNNYRADADGRRQRAAGAERAGAVRGARRPALGARASG